MGINHGRKDQPPAQVLAGDSPIGTISDPVDLVYETIEDADVNPAAVGKGGVTQDELVHLFVFHGAPDDYNKLPLAWLALFGALAFKALN